MDPSATKAILRVLGLCVVLLLLVAAATVSVAVMVWHSEAVRKLQGCREQAANETAMLGGRVAELERDRAELRARLEEGARREKLLQRQLGAAKDEGRKLNTTLLSCWEHVTLLTDNVTALRNEVQALQAEGAQMDTRNVAVEAELARGKETLAALQRQLEAARGQQRALRGQREQCEARQSQLQDSLQDYLAEIDSLRRRLSSRAAGRRCPPFRYFVWVLASAACFASLLVSRRDANDL